MLSKVVYLLFLAFVAIEATKYSLYDDALEAVETMKNTILEKSSQEMQDFEKDYEGLRLFMNESVVANQQLMKEINQTIDVLVHNLTKLAEENGVSIDECLVFLEQLPEIDETFIDDIKKCFILSDDTSVATREVLGRVLTSVRGNANNLEYELNLCQDDTCREAVAEKAKDITKTAPHEIFGAGEMASHMTYYLKDSISLCFMKPQVNFYAVSQQLVKNIVDCAAEIIPNK